MRQSIDEWIFHSHWLLLRDNYPTYKGGKINATAGRSRLKL